MKSLRQIMFTIAMVIGLALSASAQKQDDQKNRPPKDPPKVDPGKKGQPPRGTPPPKDDRKKPGALYLLSVSRDDQIV